MKVETLSIDHFKITFYYKWKFFSRRLPAKCILRLMSSLLCICVSF